MSADPVQPREAIDWFGKKTPLDKKAWASLSEEARKRAFTAAWVTDLHVLQSVKDSLRQAIESGESFESWKKRVRSELGAKWRRDNSYLETVFRNNVQSAYAAGRYQAQTTPLILRMRPFWRLVVLLDGRTSEICTALAKPPTILPAEDPWWATHWPPLHHRCRTTVVSMSRRQAERAGILAKAPKAGAQEGWGSTAGLGEWQPSGEKLAPELFMPAEKAAAKALPKVEPVVEPPAKVVPVIAAPVKVETTPKPIEPKPAQPKVESRPEPAMAKPAAPPKPKKPAAPKPDAEAPPAWVPQKLEDLKDRDVRYLKMSGGKQDMTQESRELLEKYASPEEREAIKMYTGSAYKLIRMHESGVGDDAVRARYSEEGLAAAKRASALIESAFRKVPPSPMTTYRGLSDVPKEKVAAILAAGGFVTEATTSTSRNPTTAKDFSSYSGEDDMAVVYIIRQKSGILVEGGSRYEEEREILIAKGKRFRVISAHRDASDRRRVIIELEEV